MSRLLQLLELAEGSEASAGVVALALALGPVHGRLGVLNGGWIVLSACLRIYLIKFFRVLVLALICMQVRSHARSDEGLGVASPTCGLLLRLRVVHSGMTLRLQQVGVEDKLVGPVREGVILGRASLQIVLLK